MFSLFIRSQNSSNMKNHKTAVQRVQLIDISMCKTTFKWKTSRRLKDQKCNSSRYIKLFNEKLGLCDTCIVSMKTKKRTGQLMRQSPLQRATPRIKCQLET